MSKEKSRFMTWIDDRLPVTETWDKHVGKYYVAKSLNFWYLFGVFSLLVLVNQIVTGIWLAMYYTPTATGAFDSVQHIMRNVKYGWLLRYMHSVGASAFFVVVYLHIYRCVMYGSYKKPRELLWLIGMLLYVMLVAEAFTGYVLPWGQMSYWATQVVASLFKAIPLVGEHVAVWAQGDYKVSGVMLHRFYALHVIAIPFLIVALVVFHISALHKTGSNNPDGIEIKEAKGEDDQPKDAIPFHPYYTVKDLLGVVVFLIIFAAILFFMPTMGGYFLEPDNFSPANPLVTPEHIAPVWYLAPFYAMLRAVPDKIFGASLMGAAIAFLFVLPWLDRSPVKSMRYKGVLSKIALTVFVISFIALGFLGTKPVIPVYVWLARIFTVLYFAFFILMPFYTRYEHIKHVPKRVTYHG